MFHLFGTGDHSWVRWFPLHGTAPAYISHCISYLYLCISGQALYSAPFCSSAWPFHQSFTNPMFDLQLPMIVCFLLKVKSVFEQDGFSRQKRGYRDINDIEVNMSDPLFTKQWYLVSKQRGSCPRAAWPFAPNIAFFHLNDSEARHIPHYSLNQCCYSFFN